MSPLMERALAEVAQLPEPDQEAIAADILERLDADRRWDDLLARPESAEALARMADRALEGVRAGLAKKLNLDEL